MSDLPPIPHPNVRRKCRPGPVAVRLEFSSAIEPEETPNQAGQEAWFGPFASAWIYGGTLMALSIDEETEFTVAEQVSVPEYGGVAWRAEDDRLYTDVVFLHVDTRLNIPTDLELFGSLVIAEVERLVKEHADG